MCRRYWSWPDIWTKLPKFDVRQPLAVCLWAGAAHSINNLVGLHFPEVWWSPAQECPSAWLWQSCFPSIAPKRSLKQAAQPSDTRGDENSQSSPRQFCLAKYSAFCENEYFLGWRTEVRCHAGQGFLQLFFLCIFNWVFYLKSKELVPVLFTKDRPLLILMFHGAIEICPVIKSALLNEGFFPQEFSQPACTCSSIMWCVVDTFDLGVCNLLSWRKLRSCSGRVIQK